ncbi:hypothetical protein CMV_002895 [Castanea mollissima]|uniref:Uncharacterized protein n=1 Tax=Castanea mollissima TaxID=60419 RepID=A0A8J4RV09_9ROSI|nr:hypothetical protein CMV_002895 [Castanea mollissima]
MAIFPDVSIRTQTVWISDGCYSVHMMAASDMDTAVNENDRNESDEMQMQISVSQAIFASEKIEDVIPLASNAILILGQGNEQCKKGGTTLVQVMCTRDHQRNYETQNLVSKVKRSKVFNHGFKSRMITRSHPIEKQEAYMHMQFPEAAEVLSDCHFQWTSMFRKILNNVCQFEWVPWISCSVYSLVVIVASFTLRCMTPKNIELLKET